MGSHELQKQNQAPRTIKFTTSQIQVAKRDWKKTSVCTNKKTKGVRTGWVRERGGKWTNDRTQKKKKTKRLQVRKAKKAQGTRAEGVSRSHN